jgi:hypothetical protein
MKWRAVGFLLVVVGVFAVGWAGYDYWADHRYRIRHSGPGPSALVLVAKQHIPKGTSGLLVLTHSWYAPTTVPQRLAEADAISDPAYLRGRAAVVDILPGQQLVGRDFTANDFPPAGAVQTTDLAITVIGHGTVSAGGQSITCPPFTKCISGRSVHSGRLWLEASPAPGWKFTSWGDLGCRPKTSPACGVRVTRLSARFSATFAPARP